MTQPVLVTAVSQGGDRRVKKLAAVAVVLLLAALVLPKVLFAGGGTSDDLDGAASSTSTPPTTAAGPGDGPAVEAALHPISAKDPFAPLVAQAVDAPAADTATAPAIPLPPIASDPGVPIFFPSDPSPAVQFPSLTPTTAPTGTQASPVPAPTPPAIRTFRLDNIYTEGTGLLAATVRVDDTSYAVTIGQDFAFSYRVLSLNSESLCGVFLYGDKRFSLCQGERIRT